MKLITFDKKLGLPGAVCVTVGAVIGVGIFVIVGPIGMLSGPFMPLAFAVAAIPAVLGALVACALGSAIPADGGGFYYTSQLLNRYWGAAASAMVVAGAMGAMAGVCTGVAQYVQFYWPELPRPAIAVGLVLLAWGINNAGIMASEKFQIAMVVLLASALLLIIVAALLAGSHPDLDAPLPRGPGGFVEGSVLAVFSFIGFNILGELGDEVDNPRRNIPLTIGIGLAIIVLIYVGIGWVVAGTMSAEQLERSRVALLDTAMAYLPEWTQHYFTLAALAGAITSTNAVFLAVPRELSALAEERILPEWIMRYNPKRQTFPVGIAIVAVSGSAMILLDFDVDTWGLLAVGGLILASALFAVAALRLFARFPDRVATAPLPIRRLWLFPAAILAALTSLGFGGMAVALAWPVGVALAVVVGAALLLCWRSGRPGGRE